MGIVGQDLASPGSDKQDEVSVGAVVVVVVDSVAWYTAETGCTVQ